MALSKLDLDAWSSGPLKPPFKFGPNHPVRVVIDGKAEPGTIAFPLTKAPDPEYLVDLQSGGDIAVKQSELQSLSDGD
ncbi:MAG: hypothetical protein ACAI38_16590 [Myxococcota bacterium]